MTSVETDISPSEMTDVETDISLSQALLEQVEALAQELQISRNHLFALALEDFIQRHQNRQLLAQFNQAYQDGPDEEEQEWLRRMRPLHRQVLAEDEW